MPRIDPADPPFEPRVQEDLDKLMPPGMAPLALFRTLAKNPRVLGRFRRGGLLDPGSISLREREIVILRTTARCGSEYEWGVHAAFFSGPAGLSPEQVRSTVLGSPTDPCWSPAEANLLRFADALHRNAAVPDALYEEVAGDLNEAQTLEVTVLCGLYRMVSYVTEVTKVELEPGAPRFPRASEVKPNEG